MTSHYSRFLDRAAETTIASIINQLPFSLSEEQGLALFEAFYPIVREGLFAAFQLYQLRLQPPSSH